MGLDMYLHADFYVGGWEHTKEDEKELYNNILSKLELSDFRCEDSPHLTVSLCVAYWRKANQIHNWFVETIQKGKDECQKTYVSRKNLEELVELCESVLSYRGKEKEKEVASELLPPQKGFFFGSTEIDDYYWQDLEHTVDSIEAVLNNKKFDKAYFYYSSSW